MFNITLLDIFLLPFYIALIFYVAYRVRDKYYPEDHAFRKYFIPGLTVKIAGAIGICLVYVFYFGSGDTFGFFQTAQSINSSFTDSPVTWLRLVCHSPDLDNVKDSYYWSNIQESTYNGILPNYMMGSIGAVAGMFCFTQFLCIAVILASLAFTGAWALFRTFTRLYPEMIAQSAVAALFIPSVIMWGSALFKDTVCMFAISWLVYHFFKMIINRQFSISGTVVILLAGSFLILIKPYIAFVLFPTLIIRLLIGFIRSFKSLFNRTLLTGLLCIVIGLSFYKLSSAFSNSLTEIFVENLTQTIASFSKLAEDDSGSAYTLGEIDGSLTSLVKNIPAAVNVTLYRPYIWESRKPVMLLAGLESLSLLAFSIFLIAKGRQRLFGYIFKDPNLLAFLLFTVVFAYIVGITSYNFGTLSRFKIPCMPFFVISLFVIYNYYLKNSEAEPSAGNRDL